MRASVIFALTAGLATTVASTINTPQLTAQDIVMHGRRYGSELPPGNHSMLNDPTAFEFKTALMPWARGIMERRREAMAHMDLDWLNQHMRSGGTASTAQAAGSAVAGTIRIPSIMFKFANTTNPALPSAATLEGKLYSAAPPAGTYSARTYYDEISRGMVTLDGDVFGPYTVSMPDNFYEGSCNGLPGWCGDENLGALLLEVLNAAEADGVDFSPYDFDSDGQVDFVAFLHPELGGECNAVQPSAANNLWAHRFVLSHPDVVGSTFATNDAGKIIDDYIIQGAVGGASGCADSTAAMPIGTFSHETGHAFGIPDLYDTSGDTDGIGHWGLMGAGNWNVQEYPAHMTAWTLSQLGWVALDTIQPGGFRSLTVTPIFASDTAWAVCTASVAANCFSEEYFLLENRVPRGSDAFVKVPFSDGAGLLIWHVDPGLIASRSPSNAVNASAPYGLALEQADALNELHTSAGERGDTGDPWPGSTVKTTFGPSTVPDSKLNDATDSDVLIDAIAVQADSSITLTVGSGVDVMVTTNREGVTDVVVDGGTFAAPHETLWSIGASHTISVPDTQVDVTGDVRYLFESWSDVLPPINQHMVTTLDATPDTYTASLKKQTLLAATATAGGSVGADVGGPVSLPYWADTTDVATLTAAAGSGTFDAFIGDTTTTNSTLAVTMDRPWSVTASFFTPLIVAGGQLGDAMFGASYSDTLSASGGNGTYTWQIIGGALPTGLQLDSLTGVISGAATEAGDFSLLAQATSAGVTMQMTDDDSVQISVLTPSLVLDAVVDELLGTASSLSPEELLFLDFLGNDNGGLDVGDFRAWLQFTGQLSTAAAAIAPDVGGDGKPKVEDSTKRSESGGGERSARRSRKEGV